MGTCTGDASPLQAFQNYAGTGKTHLAMRLVCKLWQTIMLMGSSVGPSELVPFGTISCTH